MLTRLVGEDVEVVIRHASDEWPVRLDRSHFEQAILNLSVNARDAMPDGGRLTIDSVNCTFDEASTDNQLHLAPGQYVMLSVSDTGTGMSEEVKKRAFEPFFTTKEVGKGTGLGLAMVYGIVKQSGETCNPHTLGNPLKDVIVPGGLTDVFMLGPKKIEFHRCKICGCVTHWSPTRPAR